MKILLCAVIVVYLVQAYRLASIVQRSAGVDVSLTTMFFRALNPAEPEPGFSGMLKNVWWLLNGTQIRTVSQLINNNRHGYEFPELIKTIHFIEDKIVADIIVSISVRGAKSVEEARSNMWKIAEDIILGNTSDATSHEALSRIRSSARINEVDVETITCELKNSLDRVRDSVIIEASRGTIHK